MNYFYRFNEVPEPENTYYTAEEISKIPVYPENLELRLEWASNSDLSDLWPVHDIDNSTEPVNCESPADARRHLMTSLNYNIYEYEHDL